MEEIIGTLMEAENCRRVMTVSMCGLMEPDGNGCEGEGRGVMDRIREMDVGGGVR